MASELHVHKSFVNIYDFYNSTNLQFAILFKGQLNVDSFVSVL